MEPWVVFLAVLVGVILVGALAAAWLLNSLIEHYIHRLKEPD